VRIGFGPLDKKFLPKISSARGMSNGRQAAIMTQFASMLVQIIRFSVEYVKSFLSPTPGMVVHLYMATIPALEFKEILGVIAHIWP
jgi:hypothetical protein